METHPPQRILAAYAGGHATEGMALLVATHLTYCLACRDEVARLEALSAALEDGEPLPAPAIDNVLARLDAPAPAPPACGDAQGAAPAPLARVLGRPLNDIPWRFRLPGVAEYEISRGDEEHVSLMRVRPGAAIPAHTHEAEELTLVLSGELVDGAASYRPGDVAAADDSVDHKPRAGKHADCVCLAVLVGGLTFTGPFGRALNLFS